MKFKSCATFQAASPSFSSISLFLPATRITLLSLLLGLKTRASVFPTRTVSGQLTAAATCAGSALTEIQLCEIDSNVISLLRGKSDATL